MLLSESVLRRAVNKLLENIHIPRPHEWSRSQDREYKLHLLKSYIESLKEIDSLDFCFGFDLNKIVDETEGGRRRK